MKNADIWKPSKYELVNGELVSSKNPEEVGAGSFLLVSVIADIYNGYISEYASGKLLDLGCGKIPMYGYYRNFVTDTVCVDWINTAHKNPNIDMELDISKPLPFDDNTFDTIICSDVLEHIYNPVDVMNEMVRVCNSGGHIMINTPFTYWIHEEPYDYNRYTPYFYMKFADDREDVRLVKIKTMGGTREVIADIIGKKLQGKFPGIVQSVQKMVYSKYRKHPGRMKGWTLGVAAVYEVIKN